MKQALSPMFGLKSDSVLADNWHKAVRHEKKNGKPNPNAEYFRNFFESELPRGTLAFRNVHPRSKHITVIQENIAKFEKYPK